MNKKYPSPANPFSKDYQYYGSWEWIMDQKVFSNYLLQIHNRSRMKTARAAFLAMKALNSRNLRKHCKWVSIYKKWKRKYKRDCANSSRQLGELNVFLRCAINQAKKDDK